MDFQTVVSGVFFIESLGSSDTKTGRWLHEHIRPILTSRQMYSEPSVRTAINRNEFLGALSSIETIVRKERLAPAIQIDAHGSAYGLELASGESIAWPELAAPMRSINEASENRTLLCSSMCHGGHMSLIALSQGMFSPTPYWALIGPMNQLTAGALQDAFKLFWESMLLQSDAPAAIRSFRRAAGETAFVQCEMVFGRVFMRYLLDAVLDPDGLDHRVERVHRESGGKAPREWIRARLSDLQALQSHYRELHARYLWIDKFPHQGKHYTMTFADACRMFPNG